MKKVSTATAKQIRNFSQPEADHRVGSGRSQRLVLCAGGNGHYTVGAASTYNRQSVAGSFRRDATQSDRAGDRDAFALDQSFVERVGARSDSPR